MADQLKQTMILDRSPEIFDEPGFVSFGRLDSESDLWEHLYFMRLVDWRVFGCPSQISLGVLPVAK